MKLEIDLMEYFCSVGNFTVNGARADTDDFGSQGDESPDDAEEYECGNMTFTPHDRPSPEVLAKYSITEDEFRFIAAGLAEQLSFGGCGLCA